MTGMAAPSLKKNEGICVEKVLVWNKMMVFPLVSPLPDILLLRPFMRKGMERDEMMFQAAWNMRLSLCPLPACIHPTAVASMAIRAIVILVCTRTRPLS